MSKFFTKILYRGHSPKNDLNDFNDVFYPASPSIPVTVVYLNDSFRSG